MHYTAREYGKAFFNAYTNLRQNLTIVDIGALDVNGALKDYAPIGSKYIGLDFTEGKSVDIVLEDAYNFPLPDNYADIIVSTSCFEHSQFFWLTFMESLRVLKPEGIMYLNAPSNGFYHRHPTDNWRFYPDAAFALSNYAHYTQKLNTTVLESFIGKKYNNHNVWNDFVAVFIKNASYSDLYSNRIYNILPKYLAPTNIWLYGNKEIIRPKKLFDDEDVGTMYPSLFDAALVGDVNKIKNILSLEVNIDYIDEISGSTALYIAVQEGHFEAVEELLKANASIEIKANNGYSPLYISVENNDIDMTKLLLEHRANTEFSISTRSTPLFLATYFGYAKVAKLLLDAGANTEIKTVNSMTPLIISIQNNDFNVTKLLIEAGANLETPNGLGSTPLFIASYFGYDEILKLLLDNGANKDAQVQGISAFQAALQEDHLSTAIILADSTESFCHQIQNTEYEVKYSELCGSAENLTENLL